MTIVIIVIPLALIFLVPYVIYRLTMSSRKETTEMLLCKFLFPDGDEQKNEVIDKVMALTKEKYSREDVLEYYMKIKGLQLVDLMAYSNDRISRYLMQPTRIQLTYDEVVRFSEEFLNFPQPKGFTAVGGSFSQTKSDKEQ